MAVTQKEIAEKLGVSRQLVNFALNGVGAVSNQTRREIQEAASAMGYRTNELARAVATGRSRTLGVLAVEPGGENSFRNTTGALQEAALNGYSTKVLVLPWSADEDEIQETVRRCSSWRLDGLLAINLRPSMLESVVIEMEKAQIPVVYLEEIPTWLKFPVWVSTDEKVGVRMAFQHLYDLGHRRISFVSGAPGGEMSERRAVMFRDLLVEFGLPVHENSVALCAWEYKEIIEPAVNRLMEQPEPPTAFQCAGDSIAMVVIHSLRKRGLRIPEDVSVTGFGDFRMAMMASPPLTTLAQSFQEMGQRGIRLLLSQIERGGPSSERQCDLMRPVLVVRESTAPPPVQ